jgi:aromatic ring hydroxylase
MRAKNDSVDLTALCPELSRLAPLVDVCYSAFEALAIVTATTNGHHMAGSLHYRGLAMDLRVKHLGAVSRQRSLYSCLKRNIDSLYPGMYDVLLEDPGGDHAHIHCEASPTLLAQIAGGVVTT